MSSPADEKYHRRGARVSAATLLVLVAIQLGAILWLNHGMLVFTLDDAYIHFAIAENILDLHLGVNNTEPSAASSSILWPFLWAPFTDLPLFEYLPFLLNVGAALVTVGLFHRVVSWSLETPDGPSRWRLVALVTCLLIPATNLVGLVFTGMEHSLQVMLAVMTVAGLIVESRTGQVRWWLLMGLVAGPLIRYENLALSVPGLVYLLVRGHRWKAIATGALITAGVVSYSLVLRRLDLGWIPSSVTVKSNFLGSSGPVSAAFQGALQNLAKRGGMLFSGLMISFFAVFAARHRAKTEDAGAVDAGQLAPHDTAEGLLAGALGASLLLHLMLGKFGWYGRYEIYALAPSLIAALYVFRGSLRSALARSKPAAAALLAITSSLLLSLSYWTILLSNAMASNNIYEQQHQMHRFVTEYYRAPVAVNDLGWVAFGNPNYVLDLWGLASAEALHLRRSEPNTEWMNELAARRGVKLALIYSNWFGRLPANWQLLATLHLGGRKITASGSVVSLYALDPAVTTEIRGQLTAFKETLPEGVELKQVAPPAEAK